MPSAACAQRAITPPELITNVVPPLRACDWFMLSMQFWPLTINGVTQRTTVSLNGVQLGRCQPSLLVPSPLVAPGALVRPKDPLEYVRKLRFHQGVNSIKDYGLDQSGFAA